jgi:hypothetical protein
MYVGASENPHYDLEVKNMEENHDHVEEQPVETEEVHKGQIWFDKSLLLLAFSILITGLIYTGWGLLELFR